MKSCFFYVPKSGRTAKKDKMQCFSARFLQILQQRKAMSMSDCIFFIQVSHLPILYNTYM